MATLAGPVEWWRQAGMRALFAELSIISRYAIATIVLRGS